MITLGIILLIVGLIAKIAILSTIEIILLVIGLPLVVLGSMGRAVGGRRRYPYPGPNGRPPNARLESAGFEKRVQRSLHFALLARALRVVLAVSALRLRAGGVSGCGWLDRG
jgi:Family of unknown function (DUF6131)